MSFYPTMSLWATFPYTWNKNSFTHHTQRKTSIMLLWNISIMSFGSVWCILSFLRTPQKHALQQHWLLCIQWTHVAWVLIVWTAFLFTNAFSFCGGVFDRIILWVQSIAPIVFGNAAVALKACWLSVSVLVQWICDCSVGQLTQCVWHSSDDSTDVDKPVLWPSVHWKLSELKCCQDLSVDWHCMRPFCFVFTVGQWVRVLTGEEGRSTETVHQSDSVLWRTIEGHTTKSSEETEL